MGLRRMIATVRELYPELGSKVSLTFDGSMNSALVFTPKDSAVKELSVAVPWTLSPEEAFAAAAASRARFLADQARGDAKAAEERAAKFQAELDALVGEKPGGES